LVTFYHNYIFVRSLAQIHRQIQYLLVLFAALLTLLLHVFKDSVGSRCQISLTNTINITHITQQITLIIQPL